LDGGGVRERPRIVHVIDSLGRGGAETLLVGLLPLLAEHYEIILVTLTADSDFPPEAVVAAERHCLGYTGFKSLPRCVLALRRIIRRVRPDLVRSQLFLSSIVARLATPASIPMVFSIHSAMSADAYGKNRHALPLERFTYKPRHSVIAVSNEALADFDRHVGIKGKAFVLHNAVDEAFFSGPRTAGDGAGGGPIRLVAVGNLKEAKNYPFLVEAVRRVPTGIVTLDIYGEGHLRGLLEAEIARHGLPVRLMGKTGDIPALLGGYDAFVMPSLYEGFGIAAAEAMAAGLPMLLSDLPVLREISHGNALFFDPNDPESLAACLRALPDRTVELRAMAERGIAICREYYRRDAYLAKLMALYAGLLAPAPPGARQGPTAG
jgi:glycosyltransferase involved in cell wall biosynthesis